MSQVLINKNLAEQDRLKKTGDTHRETVVREAFKDLLKGWRCCVSWTQRGDCRRVDEPRGLTTSPGHG